MKNYYYLSTAKKNLVRHMLRNITLIGFIVASFLISVSKEIKFIYLGFFIIFLLLGISFFVSRNKYGKKAVITFIDTNSLIIAGKKYKYWDIENYWIGSLAQQIDTKYLWIKMKNKSIPFGIFLENSCGRLISETDEQEIVEEFKKHNILCYEGTIWHKKDTKKFLMYAFAIIAVTAIVGGYIYFNP